MLTEIHEIRVGKQRTPQGENFVRFERFVFKNQALRSAHSTLTNNHLKLKNYVALRTKTKSESQDARGIRQVLRLSSHHSDDRHRRSGRTHG